MSQVFVKKEYVKSPFSEWWNPQVQAGKSGEVVGHSSPFWGPIQGVVYIVSPREWVQVELFFGFTVFTI